ncbi:MAG TPA: NAD(P)(+) transhydrogenase (Re/Si-specific) subunit beta [Pyrinomonadaceae bacterium]|nr:NAD(P)(+) transhydrogenase (Re/Si-specific) subunit beta [Pyrinomonadaceae bacterium]
MSQETLDTLINLGYIVASVLFIYGLKMLSSAGTARRGNVISAAGMLLAIVATLLTRGMSFQWIVVGLAIGSVVGAWAARAVKMTAMPEMVALFNGFGGLASLLVGWVEYYEKWLGGVRAEQVGNQTATLIAVFFAVLIGGVTFTGSVVAYGKLSEKLAGRPVLFRGQRVVNGALLLAIIVLGVLLVARPAESEWVMYAIVALALTLGVMAVIPIGGADMPVVISLLNSYSGLAGAAAGFVIVNNVLIVSGSLVGASGIILTSIMCRAMNRSLGNVLFSGFGAVGGGGGQKRLVGDVKATTHEDAYLVLESARSVVFVPGYGMAVAQAQHAVRELGDLLEANGAEVNYAIHPVAGRMPGHMNVLLAEADVPYEQLVEMDVINPQMPTVDVAVVIGANDVVNPAAREDPASPIHGMPIINVDQARTVFVLKRSMASGFAGIENPLFYGDNVRMLFGDAKQSIQQLVAEFKNT